MTEANVTPLLPKTRKPRAARIDAVDHKARAIQQCSVALRALGDDSAACQRVLDYVTRRFVRAAD